MKCCGMSMTLSTSKQINAFLIKSKPISDRNFYYLLAFTFLMSLMNEILINYCYSKENKSNFKDILLVIFTSFFSFYIAWALMMLSMTSNVYILICIVLGKIVGRIWWIRKGKLKRNDCCY